MYATLSLWEQGGREKHNRQKKFSRTRIREPWVRGQWEQYLMSRKEGLGHSWEAELQDLAEI